MLTIPRLGLDSTVDVKNVLEKLKNVKKRKNVTGIKNVKNVFYIYGINVSPALLGQVGSRSATVCIACYLL